MLLQVPLPAPGIRDWLRRDRGCLRPPSLPPSLAGSSERSSSSSAQDWLQLLNQSLRLHILISYFQAINRRPTAGFPPLPKFFLSILIHGSEKQGLWGETASWCHESGVLLQRAGEKKGEKLSSGIALLVMPLHAGFWFQQSYNTSLPWMLGDWQNGAQRRRGEGIRTLQYKCLTRQIFIF